MRIRRRLGRWKAEWTGRASRALRARSLTEADVAPPTNSDLYIGGLTGRSGTSWLRDVLEELLGPEHHAIPELGFFGFPRFRNAGFDVYAPQRPARAAFLEEFGTFVARGSGRRARYGAGPAGIRAALPRRTIRMALDLLEREALEARTLEECHHCFGRFYGRLLNAYALLHGGTPRWISKEPPYAKFADFLYLLIPEARLVVLVRDGRDTALSMARKGWEDGEIRACIDRWRALSEVALEAMARVPDRDLLPIRYEDMVADLEGEVERVLRFFGMERAGELARRVREEGFPHRPHGDSVGKWRDALPDAEVRYFEETCGPLMSRLGYPGFRDDAEGTPGRRRLRPLRPSRHGPSGREGAPRVPDPGPRTPGSGGSERTRDGT